MGELASGRVGEWASGRVGEWASGRGGEWASGWVRVRVRAHRRILTRSDLNQNSVRT